MSEIKAPKIAVFGGSFDPFHNGHLAMIEHFLGHFNVQNLFLLPTYRSPFKDESFFTPQTRLAMCECIATHINAQKNMPLIKVCDFEITQNKTTYSVESIEFLSQSLGVQQFYFLLGFDSFVSLAQWKDISQLIKRVEFVVFGRDSTSNEDFTNAFDCLCARLDSLPQKAKQASKELLRAHFLPLYQDIASSTIKHNLARFGIQSVMQQIPPPLHSLLMNSAIIAH